MDFQTSPTLLRFVFSLLSPSDPQVRWKDLITDLNLTPSSLNPERIEDDAALPLPLRCVEINVRPPGS